jgi:hypothetical protein
MIGKGYRPSIRQLQLDFAARLSRKRMLENIRKKRPAPAKTITDNSEPWHPNPTCVADFIAISDQIEASEKLWRSRFSAS